MDGRREPTRAAAPRWVWVAVAVLLAGLLVYALRGLLTSVLLAFFIAYLLDPVVDRFEARGVPRAAGIVILLAGVLGALGLFLVLVVPTIVRDLVTFVGSLPHRLEQLVIAVEPLLHRLGLQVPHTIGEALDQWQLDAQQVAAQVVTPLGTALRWLVGGTVSLVGALAAAVMVPVFAFYLLHDFDRITAAIGDLVPRRYRARVVEMAHEVDDVLGQFVRGQLLVMLILAVLYSVGYEIVGVRLALLVGLVAGLLAFIPYVGSVTALVLGLLMSILDWGGPWQLVGVVVVYAIVQMLEGLVITPRVMGGRVGLPPVWVLFAVMAGGELFGFLGVLLAVPAASVVKIFVVRGVEYYRQTPYFLQEPPPSEPHPSRKS